MATYKFDNDSLSVLQASIYPKEWNSITAAQLFECIEMMGGSQELSSVLEGFNNFLSAVSNDQELDENVLLVKANSGLFESVTGPRILASENGEELILKFGENKLPVIQDGMKLSVGRLSGELVMSEVGDDKILIVNCDMREQGSRDIYSIPVRVLREIADDEDEMTPLTKGDLIYFLEQGTPLAELCNRDKSGSGFMKMQELGLGRFPVVSIEMKDVEWQGKKFKSYSLILADGRKVGARGGSERIAKMGVQINPEQPWCLLITKVEEVKGKWYVDNVLLPYQTAMLQERQAAKPAALPPATKAPTKKKASKGNTAPGQTIEAKATTVAELDFDDIPF